MFKTVPFIPQHDVMDCGPACLAMIAKYYGKSYSLQFLRENAYYTREGVSLQGLAEASKVMGFESVAVKFSFDKFIKEAELPCILYWIGSHFVVLYKIKKKLFSNKLQFYIVDPASGHRVIDEDQFSDCWLTFQDFNGVAFFLEPTQKFYSTEGRKDKNVNIKYLLKYFVPHRLTVIQLMLGLFLGSLLSLIFPITTQLLIDKGIEAKNISNVTIILLAQLAVFLGSTGIEVIRNWLLMYLGASIDIEIVTDFFKKVLKLPLRFFDTRFLGDFYQRVNDHSRVKEFLTSHSLVTFFSLITFSFYFVVLYIYDLKILFIYVLLTALAILWASFFFKKRESLDYLRFKNNSNNQQAINEMINGIHDVKLNNLEDLKIKNWQNIQIGVFQINLRVLKTDQLQLIGFDFINQLKNIIVTFICAREVVIGNLTLGAMLSISYIIGQMNSPISQLINFLRSYQDAQLSLRRLTEVQEEEEEENDKMLKNFEGNEKMGISISNLSFQYEGPQSPKVLDNINLFIPEGKTVAIVGGSGSGKTTLLKILLKFYTPTMGDIKINNIDFSLISPKEYRKNCGTVMQDGYVFGDTVERNIATSDEEIDNEKLVMAMKVANIYDFVESLPKKTKSLLGNSGNGISGGQKQRILIARAVYRNPKYLFFDEATSALDTENESIIHSNLNLFLKGKTVVIVAHRLSTVKNADKIIVLQTGKIVESGTHSDLVSQRGTYFNLIKNQLQLENK